ncbi:hypothetical protein SDC9_189684 [bioreactor metagenome]|uniref:Uncharacterized protein n=1 Tax=bioreactor metagenome TaxID=1076179 RepID=A0A645HSV1_9ZZZZ
MLRIKKSHINNQWIVYNPKDFKYHTHCDSLKIAKIIRDNVCKDRVPKSCCVRLIESHMRLADDKRYIDALTLRVKEILKKRGQEHVI